MSLTQRTNGEVFDAEGCHIGHIWRSDASFHPREGSSRPLTRPELLDLAVMIQETYWASCLVCEGRGYVWWGPADVAESDHGLRPCTVCGRYSDEAAMRAALATLMAPQGPPTTDSPPRT